MTDFRGIPEDEIIGRIEDGESIAQIAATLSVNRCSLSTWLRAEPNRSARAHEARILSAAAFDEKAENEIRMAADQFELSRAKEIAHHYRWRASKISPKYGDKVQHTGEDGGPLQATVTVKFVQPDKSSS